MQSKSPPQGRAIRVFVSSTFRDMQEERDVLIKRIFPQLRRLCEERDVTWTAVDLRWGVTQEEAERGETLPLCLAEIDRCRPFFIGLLGERYGWVPVEISDELVESQPWLRGCKERSISELEILHGALNDPIKSGGAFFYFRDPAYVDALPASQQDGFQEAPTSEETREWGLEETTRRARERTQKLDSLKNQIRESGLPLRENYSDPHVLGQLVLRDFTDVINQLFPHESILDSLQRESEEHEAFARSRTRVYIPRGKYFDRLDDHVVSAGPPLVVLGEAGSGKSALLANWASDYRQSHPADFVLMHFVGASQDSADWRTMLRRILGELKQHFRIQQDIPNQPSALREAFANWLHMIEDQRDHASDRVVIVIDALNQLENHSGALNLVWLPQALLKKARLVVSTLPGPALDELRRRGWPSLTVQPLGLEERQRLIVQYLHQYAKKLNKEQSRRIAAADQAANPLYLRVLLEELRVFGIHEELDSRVDQYLEAQTPDHLYQLVLQRWEEDYASEHPGLVRDAMSLLWAARQGLSESELLHLLGDESAPLPRAHWSPLLLAAEPSLVNRSGLLGFFHDYLHQAIQQRYLPTESARSAVHGRLADFCRVHVDRLFEAADAESPIHLTLKDKRYVSELLNHLILADRPSEVHDLCTNRKYWRTRITASADLLDIGYQIERLVRALPSWAGRGLYVHNYVAGIAHNLIASCGAYLPGRLLLGLRNARLLLEEGDTPEASAAAFILANCEKNILHADKPLGETKPPVLDESGEPEQVFCRDCGESMHKLQSGEDPEAMLRQRGISRQNAPRPGEDVWLCLNCGWYTNDWLSRCPECGRFGLIEFQSGYPPFALVCPTCGWEYMV